jgi:glycosyltransferase involved in cell wall biosynthesis
MRILLISDYATPTGGAELMVLSLRDALRRRGHDARLFASSARPLGLPSQADYECFGIASRLRGLIQVGNPSAFWRLRQVLRDFQPDVAHVRLFLGQLSPAILPLLRKIPAIHHVAWYRSICPIGTKMLPGGASCHEPAGAACLRHRCFPAWAWPPAMLQMNLSRRWQASFNIVVANSYATRQRLEEEGVHPVEVIWNGVPVRALRGPLAEHPTVVFAGRLLWEKGADLLLDAFAQVVTRVPGAKLLIAGDGPERSNIVSRIDRLRLHSNVRLLGHLSRPDLEREFANAWVQVVPSRWEEPFGLVAAEALMRGTAVIASNAGGLAEFVRHDETGILVAPQDPRALAEALQALLLNPELAHGMGLRGRAFAMQHLTEDIFVDRFVNLYEILCQSSPVPAAAVAI